MPVQTSFTRQQQQCRETRCPYISSTHTLAAHTRSASPFLRMFSLVSWGVWVDTSALLFIKAFITSALLCHPVRGSRRCPLTHKHLQRSSGGLTCPADVNDFTRYRIPLRLYRLSLSKHFAHMAAALSSRRNTVWEQNQTCRLCITFLIVLWKKM